MGILNFTEIATTVPILTNSAITNTDLYSKIQNHKNNFKDAKVILYIDGPILLFSKISSLSTKECIKNLEEVEVDNEEEYREILERNAQILMNDRIKDLENILLDLLYYNISIDEVYLYFDGVSPKAKTYTKEKRRTDNTRYLFSKCLSATIKEFVKYPISLKYCTQLVNVVNLEKGEAEMEMVKNSNENNINIFYTIDTDIYLIGYGLKNSYVYSKRNTYDLEAIRSHCNLPKFVFRLMFLMCGSDFIKGLLTSTLMIEILRMIMIIYSPKVSKYSKLNEFKRDQLSIFQNKYDNIKIVKEKHIKSFFIDLINALCDYRHKYNIITSVNCGVRRQNDLQELQEFMCQLVWNMNYLEMGKKYIYYNKDIQYIENINITNFIFKIVKEHYKSFTIDENENLNTLIKELYIYKLNEKLKTLF